ncbi:hypothetical protein MBAV_002574 [Candidatus Magnetobacterium bavaricum]|uniref:Uncharacterized protein n=1 Tax=Candidatus Magnetobacterium bavaricum TaxID=29290 RepID=A0A0F3GTR6_9BACT|nr:hypothetical protein MBAV_002574 [Candidatus Magnetobacterium bavaricum]
MANWYSFVSRDAITSNIRQALCRNKESRTKQDAVIEAMRRRSKLNDSFIVSL